MKSKRNRDSARVDGRRTSAGPRVPRTYIKPELVSYGNLVDLTRTVGGGDPDGLIGTAGT
jgi:hypothetical protein